MCLTIFDWQILEHTDLKSKFWDSLLTFVAKKMLPKYNGLLNGDITPEGAQPSLPPAERFTLALEQLFQAVINKPEEVT
jgi:hypothetical protein